MPRKTGFYFLKGFEGDIPEEVQPAYWSQEDEYWSLLGIGNPVSSDGLNGMGLAVVGPMETRDGRRTG